MSKVIHSSELSFWMSRLIESTYGTPRAANADWRRLILANPQIAVLDLSTANDAGQTNGSDIPEESWGLINKTSVTLTFDFDFNTIGYFLHLLKGSASVSGSGADKTHTFSPQNMTSSREAKTRTFGQKAGDIEVFPSMAVTSLTIQKNGIGKLQVSVSLEGNGAKLVNPASYAVPSKPTDRVFAFNNNVELVFDDGDNSDNLTCDIETWSLSFANNQLGDGIRDCSGYAVTNEPKSGQIKTEHLIGVRTYELSFTKRLKAADYLVGMFQNQKSVEVVTTVLSKEDIPTTTTKFSYSETFTKAKLSEVKKEIQGDIVVISGKATAFATDGVFGATSALVNNITSYTS